MPIPKEAEAASIWWLTGWHYRQRLVIDPANDTWDNYQINLTLYSGVGNTVNQTVYLNDHANDNFSDIRFTHVNSALVQYDYWIENYTSGVMANVWVEIPHINNDSITQFYIYYNHTDAPPTGNGTATFPFFEDFVPDDIRGNETNCIAAMMWDREHNMSIWRNYSTDKIITFYYNFSVIVTYSNTNGIIGLIGVSNDTLYYSCDDFVTGDMYLMVKYASGTNWNLRIYNISVGPTKFDASSNLNYNTTYYCSVNRTTAATSIGCDIYTDAAHLNHVDTIVVGDYDAGDTWDYFYPIISYNSSTNTANMSLRIKSITYNDALQPIWNTALYNQTSDHFYLLNDCMMLLKTYRYEADLSTTRWLSPRSETFIADGGLAIVPSGHNAMSSGHGIIYTNHTYLVTDNTSVVFLVTENSLGSVNTGFYGNAAGSIDNAGARDIFYYQTHWDDYTWTRIRINDASIYNSTQYGPVRPGRVEVSINASYVNITHNRSGIWNSSGPVAAFEPLHIWAGGPDDMRGIAEIDYIFLRNFTFSGPILNGTNTGEIYYYDLLGLSGLSDAILAIIGEWFPLIIIMIVVTLIIFYMLGMKKGGD